MTKRTELRAFLSNNWRNVLLSGMALIVVGIIGSVLVFTKAAGSVVSTETESGTKSTQATQVTDATASGSQAVKFTAPSSSGTDFCSTSPALPSVKPTPSNTGVPAGTVLTPSGDINVTTAGAVINAKDISGDIVISANNVTIKNSKIHSDGSGYWTIKTSGSYTGTKLINNEIYSDNGGYIGVYLEDAFICGNYVHSFENGMTLGNNVMVQANYIDRLKGNQAGAHYDGIEIYDGGNSKYWGNNILMTDANGNWLTETGALNLTAWNTNIDNVEMNGNWLGGGSYTLYVDEQNGFQATNVKITNNRFYRNTAEWGTHSIDDDSSVILWSGNVYDDNGQTISF
jgi:hypothetical protein